MIILTERSDIPDLLKFNHEVYHKVNGLFGQSDLYYNLLRFSMRSSKGIRKSHRDEQIFNLCLALSWLFAINNQLHIDLAEVIWRYFPACCTYCADTSIPPLQRANKPCICSHPPGRQNVEGDRRNKPRTLWGWQKMFENIYPSSQRTPELAALHLNEELGELAESLFAHKGTRQEQTRLKIELEIADVFSTIMAVANSLNINLIEEYVLLFSDGCHLCHKPRCICTFQDLCTVSDHKHIH